MHAFHGKLCPFELPPINFAVGPLANTVLVVVVVPCNVEYLCSQRKISPADGEQDYFFIGGALQFEDDHFSGKLVVPLKTVTLLTVPYLICQVLICQSRESKHLLLV